MGIHRQSDCQRQLRPSGGSRLLRRRNSPAISRRIEFFGLEYYSDFGKIDNFLPLQQQSQQLYAVTDFKVKTVDVELGNRLRLHFRIGSAHAVARGRQFFQPLDLGRRTTIRCRLTNL